MTRQSARADVPLGRPDRKAVCWAAALVVATAIAVFSPSLRNDYTHDDLWALRDNTYYRGNQVFWNLLNKNYFHMSAETTYRPMVTASYVLDHALWTRRLPEDWPQWTAAQYKLFVQDNLVRWRVGMHAHNLLLHAINCLLVFMLVLRLWNWRAAFIAGMLFAIHPVQAEVVNAVGYREDLQATLFVLLAMQAFLTWRSRAAVPVATACYALALLAKESAGMLPAALFAAEWIMGRRKFSVRSLFVAYGGFAVVAALYLCLRFGWMYNPVESDVPYLGGSFRTAFYTMWPNLLREFKLILLPVGLSVHYDIVPSLSPFAPEVLIAAAYLAGLVVALAALRRRVPLLPAGFAWYFLMLLPTCNLLPIPGIVNDRYLYLPLVGLFTPVGIGVSAAWERGSGNRRTAIALAFAALFAVYAVLSVRRTFEWRDERALGLSTIRTNYRSIPSWLNYANDCMDRGCLDEARRSLQYLAAVRPDIPHPYGQMGHVFEKLGNPDAAEEAYRAGLARDPEDMVALNSLGVLRMKQRRYEEAAAFFQKVVDQQKTTTEVMINYATALSFLGEREKAEAILERTARKYPYAEAARNALGNMYYRTERYEAALREHLRALELSPGNPAVLGNVAADCMALKRHAEAVPYLRLLLRQRPNDTQARARLAACLVLTGHADEAREIVRDAPAAQTDSH